VASPSPDAPLSRYIQRVRALPTLTRQEEHELALRALEGDQHAIDGLVEANLRYVVAVALQYRRYGVRLADLVAEGNLGLMMAVRKFDPHRGTRFVTYAGYWIRAYVLDAVVRHTSLVGAGSGPLRSKLFFRLRRERARVANLASDPQAQSEILAERFGVSPEKMGEMMRRIESRDVSLDQPLYDDSGVSMVDTLRGVADSQEDTYRDRELSSAVGDRLDVAMADLDRRERYIVEQRLMSEEGMSLAAIGRELGVSRERARQLEARAKRKLRKSLSEFQAAVA